MKVRWSKRAYKEKEIWRNKDKKIYQKIIQLLENIKDTPYSGLGKPELLRYELSGFWSRRITIEHRLVYRVVEGRIEVLSCMYHYD
ncbi:Txe/YoeB family addiction module toxin [Hutsoniella sourekii]|uniref:Txe/YoeB family addiction module toxin n=1 Tax=Hutsoniella sourekii TaxID=87650 RepID=UPI00048260FA|nr:Txe/YoeB family addiction module toxin [Hutsoniella sourekii]